MPLYEVCDKKPIIGDKTWIAPSAEIIGDVKIGKNCYIGFGAIIRGDIGPIIIGDETVIEENVVIHAGSNTIIENRVIIGHMVMIHDTLIKDHSLIGMMSMICDDSVIGSWSILAEKSLVRKKQEIPSGLIYGGSPARKIGQLEKKHKEYLISGHQIYLDLVAQYHNTFKRID